jgi:hypothetical protein
VTTEAAPEALFEDLARRFLREPDVEEGKAFHSHALKARGKIFAMLVQEELVLKLPPRRGASRPCGGRRRAAVRVGRPGACGSGSRWLIRTCAPGSGSPRGARVRPRLTAPTAIVLFE